MLVGILSDSHGHFRRVASAVALFERHGAGHIIHCGDVGGTSVFDEFIGRPFTFVWGNTDQAERGLLAYLESTGIAVPEAVPTRIELDGKRFAVFHGHERAFGADPTRLGVDYILHGHTHAQRDERIGPVRIINPGALVRARAHTVATLDTATDELIFHRIED